MTTVKKDLRRHQRILVPEGSPIRCQGAGPKVEGVVTVIGLGGMFVRTQNSHPCGTELDVRIRTEFSAFDVKCAVRHVAPNGLGIEFLSLTSENDKRLRELLFRLML